MEGKSEIHRARWIVVPLHKEPWGDCALYSEVKLLACLFFKRLFFPLNRLPSR
jgi:hypothetical protein